MGKTKSKHFNKNNLRRTYKRRYKGGSVKLSSLNPYGVVKRAATGVLGMKGSRWPTMPVKDPIVTTMEDLGVEQEEYFPNKDGIVEGRGTAGNASAPLIGFEPPKNGKFVAPINPHSNNPYRPGNIIGAMVSISETANQIQYAKEQLREAKKKYFYDDNTPMPNNLRYNSGDYAYLAALSDDPATTSTWAGGPMEPWPANVNMRTVNAGDGTDGAGGKDANDQMIQNIYMAVDDYFFTGPNKFTRSAPTDSVPGSAANPNTANVDSLSSIMTDQYRQPDGMYTRLANPDSNMKSELEKITEMVGTRIPFASST